MSAAGPVRQGPATRDDWETPQPIFDKLYREFEFDLDAAASPAAHKTYDHLIGPCRGDECRTCGLHASWGSIHSRVWLNPPYGRGLADWVAKCIDESRNGDLVTVVALLPDAIDTAWFRDVFRTAWEIRIVVGRIQFVGTTSSNPCGSIIAVWRPGPRPYGQPAFSLWEQL